MDRNNSTTPEREKDQQIPFLSDTLVLLIFLLLIVIFSKFKHKCPLNLIYITSKP